MRNIIFVSLIYLNKRLINLFIDRCNMKRQYIISFVVSSLIFWAICYFFNTTAILGKVVFAKAFISPWLTYTTVMQYLHLGMGVASWVAYVLAAILLIFLWASVYFFVYFLLLAIAQKRK